MDENNGIGNIGFNYPLVLPDTNFNSNIYYDTYELFIEVYL